MCKLFDGKKSWIGVSRRKIYLDQHLSTKEVLLLLLLLRSIIIIWNIIIWRIITVIIIWSPKGQSIRAIPQAWMYFNPDSQVALWSMLSYWVRVQRSTVGRCEQHDARKHQYVVPSAWPTQFLYRVPGTAIFPRTSLLRTC